MSSDGSIDDEPIDDKPIDDKAVRRNVWRLLLIVGPLSGVGGFFGSWLSDHSRHNAGHHHGISAVAAVIVIAVILVIGVAVNWFVWRRRLRDPAFRRTLQYTMTERRRALRDFRRGRQLTNRQRQIVSATLALAQRNQKYLPVTLVIITSIGAISVVVRHGEARWFWIGYIILFPALVTWSYVRVRGLLRRAQQSGIELQS